MKAEYICHMGDDKFIANVARVSFDKWGDGDFITREMLEKGSDEALLQYLSKKDHWTPYAHPHVSLRVSAPIPIRTQCFKHKVGFVENEISRRYVSYSPDVFTPESFRSAPEGSIKQGSGEDHDRSGAFINEYNRICADLVSAYEEMIADGVCPEQARFILPQGVETQWIWTGSLYAYARFYRQRTDSHSQKEIQDLARMIGEIIEPLFPVAWRELTRNV